MNLRFDIAGTGFLQRSQGDFVTSQVLFSLLSECHLPGILF
jgi:hypothetical protein